MFSSSLRSRADWARIVPVLAQSRVGWTETRLDGCDVAFPVMNASPNELFRVILFSSDELSGAGARASIERLLHLDGGSRIGIVVYLHGEAAMTNWAKLQADLLLKRSHVHIVPISSPEELPACLADWRRQLSNPVSGAKLPETPKTLVSHSVHGRPLTERQTNILMDICSGFRDLAQKVNDPAGMQHLVDFLGQKDAERVSQFMRGGPESMDI